MKKIAAVNRNALCKPRPYIVALTKPEGFVMVNNSFPFQINGSYHLKLMNFMPDRAEFCRSDAMWTWEMFYSTSPSLSTIRKTTEKSFGRSHWILLRISIFYRSPCLILYHQVLAFNQKNRLTCLVMQVEEHASCKCDCLITEKHCQKHQVKYLS